MVNYGPNVSRLILAFSSRIAIPKGGGIADALEFFQNVDHRRKVMAEAEASALAAISLIKTAKDNPYGQDDEHIAGVILEEIEKKRRSQHTP